MEDVWKKVGDAFGWISKSFGYKQARTKIKHSDLDIDLDSKLECVCEDPEKVCEENAPPLQPVQILNGQYHHDKI